MRGLASIQSKCTSIKPPAKKKRPTVASFCLTKKIDEASWVIIGVPDDRGVKNNFGRIGAKSGPNAFRKVFYNQAIGASHPAEKSIFDLGNLKLTANIKTTHERLANIITLIKKANPKTKVLVLGGGHDIAYGEIHGCIQASSSSVVLNHIVNVDAHSDVRPLEKGAKISSGTPFYRLIKDAKVKGSHYHPFGLQKPSNNRNLVDWMQVHRVDAHWLEDMPTNQAQVSNFHKLIQSMKIKKWHLNIDLDGFSVEHAPGVSAQATYGLTPNMFLGLEKTSSSFDSLESMGIYELAPKFDIDNRTAKLAAKLAYTVMSLTS